MKHFLAVFGFRFNYTYTIAAFCFSVFAMSCPAIEAFSVSPPATPPLSCDVCSMGAKMPVARPFPCQERIQFGMP